jgi:hypothetical protein
MQAQFQALSVDKARLLKLNRHNHTPTFGKKSRGTGGAGRITATSVDAKRPGFALVTIPLDRPAP